MVQEEGIQFNFFIAAFSIEQSKTILDFIDKFFICLWEAIIAHPSRTRII